MKYIPDTILLKYNYSSNFMVLFYLQGESQMVIYYKVVVLFI